jgi:hypothetical protein
LTVGRVLDEYRALPKTGDVVSGSEKPVGAEAHTVNAEYEIISGG